MVSRTGITINVFELPTVTIFAIRGAGNHIDVSSPNISITDHLRRWDSDCSYEELLVSFGLEEDADETIEEADEDDTNVRIWCSYYYTDKNSWPISGYETDEDRDHLVFATFAEAEAWINTETGGTYHLRCNEYARPSYTIVR